MTSFVVDTNVAVVANGGHPQAALRCCSACSRALQAIQGHGRVALDAGTLILEEYRRNVNPGGQRAVGDAFFRWLWLNKDVPERCERVRITRRDGSFAEFPDDPALAGFHDDDRKFVAVALASTSRPEVLNAVDSDWWDFQEPLKRHGVRVRFLCPEQFAGRGA